MKYFSDLILFKEFLKPDSNGRIINIYKSNNCHVVSKSLDYPNVILKSSDIIFNPVLETTMSLKKETNKNLELVDAKPDSIYTSPLFFFIYNTENYFHYVYDTLPYLISYLELRKEIPSLKLLMAKPKSSDNKLVKFVQEFLQILEISYDDIEFIKSNTLYKEIYFSNSYTHDFDSNLPPRDEIYDFYNKIVDNVKRKHQIDRKLPSKIYVSRRSWIHGDLSNIGTNYTNRRKLDCEDDLVNFLNLEGFEETFAEKLSTVDKILLFNNCDFVIGAIGGGLVNLLFSKPNCKLISICSPEFININSRFLFSFKNIKSFEFHETYHTENDFWKKSMRVQCGDIVGEIESIDCDYLVVNYLNEKVAGWRSTADFKKIRVPKNECIALDYGLNSAWTFDMSVFKEYYKKIKNK